MKVGGRDFSLTKEEVEACMQGAEPELIHRHVVEVNGEWYPPKQVLGRATGWARTSFTTMDAQRVLTRIGFECTELRGGMIRQAGEFVADAVRGSVQQTKTEHGDAEHLKGFSKAASISLRRIQAKLDGFREQMKGPGLGPTEQAVYAHLDELKSEIEADCDRYWRDSGADWRPRRPVTKAIIRPASRAES